MYSNFDNADKVMYDKGYESVDIVNFNSQNNWDFVHYDVPVFSAPIKQSTSKGDIWFELQKEKVNFLTHSIKYKNFFFGKNLNDLVKSTTCLLKNSIHFPLKKDKNFVKLEKLDYSEDVFEIDSLLHLHNEDRYFLKQFDKQFDTNMLLTYITKFQIKLYKHNTTNEYAFFWILNNNILFENTFETIKKKKEEMKVKKGKEQNAEDIFNTLFEIYNSISLKNIPKNLIVYGSPGTGKSHYLDTVTCCSPNVFTVTFHPDYDYSDFIGTYKPKSITCKDDTQDDDKCKSKIIYTFVPGILLKTLKKAINDPDENFILKIEEINRGNTATIFGDIFQLLDRNENGESKYSIEASEEIFSYLKINKIKIPKNLYILATMNTSDQSLFPMDSAFKRRWTWKHIPIDLDDAKKLTIKISGIKDINWSDFIEIINKKILTITDSEDKQLGNRFVNPPKNEIDADTFVGKVLFYLWSDIFKQEDHTDEDNIFKSLKEDPNSSTEKISFSLLYETNGDVNIDKLKELLKDLGFDV